MLGLIGMVIVVVVIILTLLLFRGFGAGAKSGAGATGGKKIVPVEGLTANPGFVSAWVSPSGNVTEVLRVAGLENSNITDLGGGRYVISVPVGTEETVVRILAEIDGVYDAGRVYGEAP
jgi:ABC-type cobalt transport system substrate-binding protein